MCAVARDHVRRLAAADRDQARRRLAELLRGDPDHLVAGVLRRARLTVNFHPDRLVDGRTVAEHLAVGASPRFGSRYLQLHADALARTTFCHGDSVTEPDVLRMFVQAIEVGYVTALSDVREGSVKVEL